MAALAAYVDGIGLLGPGIGDWPAGVRLLAGETAWVRAPTVLPAPECLPSAERRRTGTVVRLALAVGLEATARAGADPAALAAVFTSSGGDGQNCHEICQVLASAERHLSPTRVHNSVHKGAGGERRVADGTDGFAERCPGGWHGRGGARCPGPVDSRRPQPAAARAPGAAHQRPRGPRLPRWQAPGCGRERMPLRTSPFSQRGSDLWFVRSAGSSKE